MLCLYLFFTWVRSARLYPWGGTLTQSLSRHSSSFACRVNKKELLAENTRIMAKKNYWDFFAWIHDEVKLLLQVTQSVKVLFHRTHCALKDFSIACSVCCCTEQKRNSDFRHFDANTNEESCLQLQQAGKAKWGESWYLHLNQLWAVWQNGDQSSMNLAAQWQLGIASDLWPSCTWSICELHCPLHRDHTVLLGLHIHLCYLLLM